MRRFLRHLFAIFLVLDVVALVVVYKGTVGTHLSAVFVDIRNAVFGKFDNDLSVFEMPPETLYAHGFLHDSPEKCAWWKRTLNDTLRYHALFDNVAATSSTIEKAKLITLSFSRNGCEGQGASETDHRYSRTADLLLKITTMHEPRGCCSDHAQVFTALCQIAGLDAMQIECAHTTSAIYCPEFHKWVWIDSEFALMAKWPDGTYMSPLELLDANLNNKSFDYEFFGTSQHICAKMDPKSHPIYNSQSFSHLLAVEWGNNELTRDGLSRQALFLPKPVRQLIWFAIGVQPSLHYLKCDPAFVTTTLRIRLAFYAVVFCFLIGNLAFPIYLFVTWVRSLVAEYTEPNSAHVAFSDIVLEAPQQNLAV